MAYIDQEYILKKIRKDHLDLLLKPGENDTLTSADILAQAIETSDSQVDRYLKGAIKTVPMTAPPAHIKDASAILCIYNLHGRIDYGDIPPYWETQYKETIKFLERVQDGKANVEITDASDAAPGTVAYFTQGRNFDDSTM